MNCLSEDLNFVTVSLLALKEGRQVKFAQCEINLGKMYSSIESLDYVGKDIVEYNPDHRAIRFYNCRIVNPEFTQNILQSASGSNNFDLMYRFISSKAILASDVLLGESLTFSFRKGPDSSDFNANIVILIGNCKVGRKAQDKSPYLRVTEQEVDVINSIIYTLNDTHTKFLIEKLASTNANAKEFEVFLRNYKNLANSRDFDSEINTIKAQIESKDKECSSKESTMNQNRSEHQKQLETLEVLRVSLEREMSTLRELNSRRTTLEREQAESHDLKKSHESRLEAMRDSRTRIEAALLSITAISKHFFIGCPACINDRGVDACCVNRVRGGPQSQSTQSFEYDNAGNAWINLPQGNTSEYKLPQRKPWGSNDSDITTTWNKIRVNPNNLAIYTNDYTHTTSKGRVSHEDPKDRVPFGIARGCESPGNPDGRAFINLVGTSFKFTANAERLFSAQGYIPAGSITISNNRQMATITGGGYCGWFAPGGDRYGGEIAGLIELA